MQYINKRRKKRPIRMDVIGFIKTPLESDYVFTFTGSEHAVDLYIKAMRTELSRLRTKARSVGKVPRHFKMCVVSVEELNQHPSAWQVTLKKTTSALNVVNELDDIMDDLAGGDIINA